MRVFSIPTARAAALDADEPAAEEGAPAAPSGTGLGSVRVPHAAAIAATACVAAFCWLMYGDRRFDFYFDEWDWLDRAARWTAGDYFVPHDEHWSTVPMLIYRLILAVQGAHSYLPFLAAMTLMHVAGAYVLFLFIGTGSQDVDWAFQVTFDGSVTFGLLALYLLRGRGGRGREVAGFASLVLALASSGIGLFYLGAVAVDLLLDRDRRRRLWTVALAGCIYAAWYATYGKQGTADDRPLSGATLKGLVGYVPDGIGTAVAGVFGRSATWGGLLLPLVLAAVAVLWYRERRDAGPAATADSPVPAVAAGLLAQYVLTGMVRASQYGAGESEQTRYVGVAAPLILIVLAEGCRGLSRRRLALPVFAAVCAVALVGNLLALRSAQHSLNAVFAVPKEKLETTWALRAAPGLDRSAVIDPGEAPTLTVADYVVSRQRFGSPLPDVSAAGLAKLSPGPVNAAMRAIMPMTYRMTTHAAPLTAVCSAVGSSGGTESFTAKGGTTFAVTASDADSVVIEYWYSGSSAGYSPSAVSVAAGSTLSATLPDAGSGLSWQVSVQSTDPAAICH